MNGEDTKACVLHYVLIYTHHRPVLLFSLTSKQIQYIRCKLQLYHPFPFFFKKDNSAWIPFIRISRCSWASVPVFLYNSRAFISINLNNPLSGMPGVFFKSCTVSSTLVAPRWSAFMLFKDCCANLRAGSYCSNFSLMNFPGWFFA